MGVSMPSRIGATSAWSTRAPAAPSPMPVPAEIAEALADEWRPRLGGNRRLRIPHVRRLRWLGGNVVRLTFQSGKIVELSLTWVDDASRARIVDVGMGVDPGDGKDVSGLLLAVSYGRVIRRGRPGWFGSNYLPAPQLHRRSSSGRNR